MFIRYTTIGLIIFTWQSLRTTRRWPAPQRCRPSWQIMVTHQQLLLTCNYRSYLQYLQMLMTMLNVYKSYINLLTTSFAKHKHAKQITPIAVVYQYHLKPATWFDFQLNISPSDNNHFQNFEIVSSDHAKYSDTSLLWLSKSSYHPEPDVMMYSTPHN